MSERESDNGPLLGLALPWILLTAFLGFAAGGSVFWALNLPDHTHGQWYNTFLEHTPDWFVALFTLALTVVTLLLVRSTNKLWEAGERQLKLVSDQFLAAFRPEIAIREVTWEPDGDGIAFIIVNRGRNPCSIIESAFEIRSDDGHGLAVQTGGANTIGPISLASGEFRRLRYELESDQEFLLAGARGSRLSRSYFRGTVVYEDAAKVRRRHAFTRICQGDGDRFLSTGNADDEYTD